MAEVDLEFDVEKSKKQSHKQDSVKSPKGLKHYRIIINKQDNWDKNNHVFARGAMTGQSYMIRRGEEVVVPEDVYDNLKNCVIEDIKYDAEGKEYRDSIPRFSIQNLGVVV